MRALVFLSILLISCNDQSVEKENISTKDSATKAKDVKPGTTIKAEGVGSIYPGKTDVFLWSINLSSKEKRRNPNFKKAWYNTDSLIKGINELYPPIKLDKIRLSGDTLYTKIDNSEYLGERMGTDGAAIWLANTIINLTSLKEVKYVKIDFEEGEHASPGIWSAADFNDYKAAK